MCDNDFEAVVAAAVEQHKLPSFIWTDAAVTELARPVLQRRKAGEGPDHGEAALSQAAREILGLGAQEKKDRSLGRTFMYRVKQAARRTSTTAPAAATTGTAAATAVPAAAASSNGSHMPHGEAYFRDQRERAHIDFNQAMQFVNKVEARFTEGARVHLRLMEILYTAHSKKITGTGTADSNKKLYECVAELLKDQHDLLSDFTHFLPPGVTGRFGPA
jgi:hypothetical protein